MTKKVNLQPNENSRNAATKRKPDADQDETMTKKGRHAQEDEDAVDYGQEESHSQSNPTVSADQPMGDNVVPHMSPEEADRARITKALESWCRNNIAMEKDDPDADDRVGALAEVGLLLVFEHEKYPNAESMRAELEDIGSIIGGEQVVTRYINFILSLQNQMKKTKMQAERQMRHHQQMMHNQQQFHPAAQNFPFPHPGGMMMMHPGGGPAMFMPPHPMYMGPHGFPMQQMQQPPHQAPPRGNMTLNTTGEMTAVQKQREKERKRKEILAECTEHLKALLERTTKTTDPTEKAKIYELIDKVKKRIDSLKEAPPAQPATAAKPAGPKGPIRGYFGNQYVNPKLAEQHQAQGSDQMPQPDDQQ